MQMLKIFLPLLMVSSLFAVSGSTLYKQKCKSCHGVKADRKAMGKSKIIKGMSVARIEKEMLAYASGKRKATSYVVRMKKAFVKKYSKKELRSLSNYIHSL